MKTTIYLYRTRAESKAAWDEACKTFVGECKMYSTTYSLDRNGEKYLYTSFERWLLDKPDATDDVEIILMCEVSEAEYLMLTREFIIKGGHYV